MEELLSPPFRDKKPPGRAIPWPLPHMSHVVQDKPLSRRERRRPNKLCVSPLWRPCPATCAGYSILRECLCACGTAKNSTADVTAAAPAPASSLNNWNPSCWPGNAPRPAMLQMPLQSMLKVERSVFATTGKAATNTMTVMGLCITGKLCQRTLRFTTASYADTVRAQEVLETYAFPGKRNMGYLFAYESKCHRVVASIKEDEKGQKQVTIPPFRRPLTLSTSTTTVSPTGKRPTIVSSMGYLEQVERFLSNMYVISPVLVGPASLDENNPKAIHMIPSCSSFQSFQ